MNIVAGKKGMLERSEIASAEERQRLLFAVLCLQLAYEPVYQLLLKDREQLGTEYFGVLSDPLQLKDRPELNETVKQALAGRGDLNDAIARFGDFMESFTQAAQLASDKAEDADQVLSQNEIDLLRGFLSLSALTSAAGGQMEAIPGTFRHKVRMLELIERELKPKYQASLAKMNSVFKTEFCGDKQGKGEGWIGFDYRLGAFSFDVWMGWKDDSQDLRASLFQASNVTNAHLAAVKNMICAWCEAQKKAFPAIQFHHLKNREFAYIEMIPFQGGDAPEAEQQRFADFSGIM